MKIAIFWLFLEKRWMAFNAEGCLSLSYAYKGFQELFQTFKAVTWRATILLWWWDNKYFSNGGGGGRINSNSSK